MGGACSDLTAALLLAVAASPVAPATRVAA
jgi:hypothetical protein